jgi:predicted nuclease of predicted toxin-antitoxin system
VKLLFDENVSSKLVEQLSDLFPGSTHLAFEGLLTASDLNIWEHAKRNGYAIVTADYDFYQMATTFGPPPKVVWLKGCDYPTKTASRLIRNNAIRLIDFAEDPDQAVLILKAYP